MADRRNGTLESTRMLDGINARLGEAARTGQPLDMIFSVRGRVSPVPGKHRGRWRVRTTQGHVLTFRPEFVIAFNGPAQVKPDIAAPDGSPT